MVRFHDNGDNSTQIIVGGDVSDRDSINNSLSQKEINLYNMKEVIGTMITLYHQQCCPQCKMVETLLNKKGIAYESNMDVDYMQSIGISSTPVLAVDDKLLKGKEIISWIKEQ